MFTQQKPSKHGHNNRSSIFYIMRQPIQPISIVIKDVMDISRKFRLPALSADASQRNILHTMRSLQVSSQDLNVENP